MFYYFSKGEFPSSGEFLYDVFLDSAANTGLSKLNCLFRAHSETVRFLRDEFLDLQLSALFC